MKKIKFNLKIKLGGPNFWKSVQEVCWFTIIAMLPLIINIGIASFEHGNLIAGINAKLKPGEVLSYCLSFIAPSMYLLVKGQGTDYKLPFIHTFSLVSLIIYISSFSLYLVSKSNWVPAINSDRSQLDSYFTTVLVFLGVSFLFRIYSVYHGKGISNYTQIRTQQQKEFNSNFSDSLNTNL